MNEDYDWYETRDNITIVFYKPEITSSDIKLVNNKKLYVKKYQAIMFYKDVEDEFILQEHYLKKEITFKKKISEKWGCLSEPSKFVREKCYLDSFDGKEEVEEDKDAMSMLKNIYERSDPDVRRAMNKSFTESNGTVLSTNWNDVGKEKVEPRK